MIENLEDAMRLRKTFMMQCIDTALERLQQTNRALAQAAIYADETNMPSIVSCIKANDESMDTLSANFSLPEEATSEPIPHNLQVKRAKQGF